ncbi:MAG: histidine kinase [Muribaculaceae bacterium]|nr:histidine kinase [Muribaculaceae bacterium]
MKRIRNFYFAFTRLSVIFLSLLLPLLPAGCRDTPSDSVLTPLERTLSDSILKGHYVWALATIERERPLTTDSDIYYSQTLLKAIAEFYMTRTDSMYTDLDAVFRYLAGLPRPLTQRQCYLAARTHMVRGASYMQYDYLPDTALISYERALSYLAPGQEPALRQQILANTADALKISGQLDRSLDYFERARHLSDSLGDTPWDRLSLNLGMAAAYTELRDFESQTPIWQEIESIWDELPVHDRFSYLTALSNSYYFRGAYTDSEHTLQRLDSVLAGKEDMEWERNFNRVNMADVYLRLNATDTARVLLDHTLHYFTNVQPNPYVSHYIGTLYTRYNVQTGAYTKVEAQLADASRDLPTRPEQRLADLEMRQDYYARTGQWHKAYMAQSQYRVLNDSLRNQRIQMYNRTLRQRYERDAEIKSLRNDLHERQQKLTLNTILAIAAITVVVLLGIVLAMSRRLARERERSMRRKLLEQRMRSVRNRLSPHFIYNALNHAIANDATSTDRLRRLVRLLRRQQLMTDDLITTLSDELAFIEDYVTLQSESSRGEVRYTTSIASGIDAAKVRLPSMTLQLCVENAFKHGFASLDNDVERLLLIKVEARDDSVVIEVCNNMNPDAEPSNDSTRTGLRIIMTTLQILNEHQSRHIMYQLEPWTDNPQRAGYMAQLIIPNNFKFDYL